ncbi:winged helix-turn-helix domain-containing protein [Streptomyces somaliensis]|uniref:winged helix-turn-helix domain-containing protein n=1 Tax=Streptomyces somaliensis TaxID=78355 RepID=UPI0034E97349
MWPQVAEELRRRLDAGMYKPGERFPGTVDIAVEFEVSQSTAQKAVVALRAEGRLYTVLGQGSFVKGDE